MAKFREISYTARTTADQLSGFCSKNTHILYTKPYTGIPGKIRQTARPLAPYGLHG
jgi:hypothetical protein